MKHEPLAYGEFTKHGEHIFRTQASIKWGNSTEKIGLLVMLNPGSSKLANPLEWERFEKSSQETSHVKGKIILDDTMKCVANILQKTHPNLKGTLDIKNLFNLRDSNSAKAIKIYKELEYKNELELTDMIHDPFKKSKLNEYPWIWLAWTVDDGKKLNMRREFIYKNLPQNKPIFAVYSNQKCHQRRKHLYTYHPCPQMQKDKAIYKERITQQMNDYFLNPNVI